MNYQRDAWLTGLFAVVAVLFGIVAGVYIANGGYVFAVAYGGSALIWCWSATIRANMAYTQGRIDVRSESYR